MTGVQTCALPISSALRRRLGAISKQGDVYLRMLLIHGARSVLVHAKRAAQPTAFQVWARTMQQRRGHNIAAVAVANKLARIVWAVWTRQQPFTAEPRGMAGSSSMTSSHQEDCTEIN